MCLFSPILITFSLQYGYLVWFSWVFPIMFLFFFFFSFLSSPYSFSLYLILPFCVFCLKILVFLLVVYLFRFLFTFFIVIILCFFRSFFLSLRTSSLCFQRFYAYLLSTFLFFFFFGLLLLLILVLSHIFLDFVIVLPILLFSNSIFFLFF